MTVSDTNALRYDEASFKASHNSYARDDFSIADQLNGDDPPHPNRPPCAGLELDIFEHESRYEWQVAHKGGYKPGDSERRSLRSWLKEIADWSALPKNKHHTVVTIHIDLKNSPKGVSTEKWAYNFDAYIADALPRGRIYSPNKVIRGAKDLVRGAAVNGWPTLAKLERKFVFCLTGGLKRKDRYAETDSRARLCFVDRSIGKWDRPPPTEGDWLFLNTGAHRKNWLNRRVRAFLRAPGFVVRTYNLANAEDWIAAHKAGVNVLATNYLDKKEFVLRGRKFKSKKA